MQSVFKFEHYGERIHLFLAAAVSLKSELHGMVELRYREMQRPKYFILIAGFFFWTIYMET